MIYGPSLSRPTCEAFRCWNSRAWLYIHCLTFSFSVLLVSFRAEPWSPGFRASVSIAHNAHQLFIEFCSLSLSVYEFV